MSAVTLQNTEGPIRTCKHKFSGKESTKFYNWDALIEKIKVDFAAFTHEL